MSVLYISYDGILEPLGQSQILGYLIPLAVGRNIHLISFEKANDWANVFERERLACEIAESGIVWHPLRYHRWPGIFAKAWDIVCGTSLGLWLVLHYQLKIVHARSYVPSVMALSIKRLTGAKYLFDMRGFWADEKLDDGWSQEGCMYRVAKDFERRFLLRADHVVSLTHAAVPIIRRFSYLRGRSLSVSVIPTCADLTLFKPIPREGKNSVFTIGYVGTAGNWYLFDETVRCFAELLRMRPNTKFLILNRHEHFYITERLAAAGVPSEAVELTAATFSEMPRLIARMDASIFFIKPVFSKQASAATKLAELLGCGVPCLSNAGIGDMAEVLEGERVGVALRAFDQSSMLIGLTRFLALVGDPAITERCVATAHRYFSLNEGVRKYRSIYETLCKL
jgi:glycosyltransferase involved in cell wall biosynthesis